MAFEVVPYIGTWIETIILQYYYRANPVVPYIGTWIETVPPADVAGPIMSYLI